MHIDERAIARFALDAMDDTERDEFVAHLASCDPCRKRVERVRTSERLQSIVRDGFHPSVATLRAFTDKPDDLPPALRDYVAKHVPTCGRCGETVEFARTLRRPDRSPPKLKRGVPVMVFAGVATTAFLGFCRPDSSSDAIWVGADVFQLSTETRPVMLHLQVDDEPRRYEVELSSDRHSYWHVLDVARKERAEGEFYVPIHIDVPDSVAMVDVTIKSWGIERTDGLVEERSVEVDLP